MNRKRTFYVEKVDRETGEIIERRGPLPPSRADREETSMAWGMDHTRYFNRILDEEGRDIDAEVAA